MIIQKEDYNIKYQFKILAGENAYIFLSPLFLKADKGCKHLSQIKNIIGVGVGVEINIRTGDRTSSGSNPRGAIIFN